VGGVLCTSRIRSPEVFVCSSTCPTSHPHRIPDRGCMNTPWCSSFYGTTCLLLVCASSTTSALKKCDCLVARPPSLTPPPTHTHTYTHTHTPSYHAAQRRPVPPQPLTASFAAFFDVQQFSIAPQPLTQSSPFVHSAQRQTRTSHHPTSRSNVRRPQLR
jgi:hypothetical protein